MGYGLVHAGARATVRLKRSKLPSFGPARGADLFNFGLHRGHRSKIFWVRFGQNTRVRLSVFLSIPSARARAATASSPGGTDTPSIWLRFGQNTWDRLVDLLHQSKYDHDKQP